MLMKRVGILCFALLGLYSVALVFVDIQLGQDVARGYFSDIITGTEHSLPYIAFFGINTTITVAMLTGISLLFLVGIGLAHQAGNPRDRMFFPWSQVLFFLLVACDERLLIHEKMGSLLQMEDAFLILGLGLVELVLLFGVGKVTRQPWNLKGWLLPAAVCFAVMVGVDGLFPDDMCGRLALEDLSKTWAIYFLLIYAWQFCMDSASLSHQRRSDGPKTETT